MPSHYDGSETEKRALGTFIKLMRASDAVAQLVRDTVTNAHLTEGQFGVLEALCHMGPLTIGDLARKHLRSPNNLSVVVDNLERDGLVRRERDTCDRRTVHVHLTDAGRDRIEAVFPVHAERIVEVMDVLTSDEQEQLGNLLRKLGRQEKTG